MSRRGIEDTVVGKTNFLIGINIFVTLLEDCLILYKQAGINNSD